MREKSGREVEGKGRETQLWGEGRQERKVQWQKESQRREKRGA